MMEKLPLPKSGLDQNENEKERTEGAGPSFKDTCMDYMEYANLNGLAHILRTDWPFFRALWIVTVLAGASEYNFSS